MPVDHSGIASRFNRPAVRSARTIGSGMLPQPDASQKQRVFRAKIGETPRPRAQHAVFLIRGQIRTIGENELHLIARIPRCIDDTFGQRMVWRGNGDEFHLPYVDALDAGDICEKRPTDADIRHARKNQLSNGTQRFRIETQRHRRETVLQKRVVRRPSERPASSHRPPARLPIPDRRTKC